jgi:hypothetical protein
LLYEEWGEDMVVLRAAGIDWSMARLAQVVEDQTRRSD